MACSERYAVRCKARAVVVVVLGEVGVGSCCLVVAVSRGRGVDVLEEAPARGVLVACTESTPGGGSSSRKTLKLAPSSTALWAE